jgi:hypothetical protein
MGYFDDRIVGVWSDGRKSAKSIGKKKKFKFWVCEKFRWDFL